MAKYGYGVDIGGTTAKIGLFTVEGKLLDKWEIKTGITDGGERIMGRIAWSIREDMSSRDISEDMVAGIGVGVPGPVRDGGVVSCVNLNWVDFPVVSTLSWLTGLKVLCANDANVAALGESWQGSGKGILNMVMVTLGTGVGGGVIINGHIHNGVHGAGGELGHITVNPSETKRCNCGNFGCLEQYASATGNVYIAEKVMAELDTPSPLRSAEKINSKLCWDLAIQGDPLAVEITNRFSNYLGMGLATIAAIIDPEMIVLGGGVSRTGEPLRQWVEKYFKKYAFPACKDIPITIASLGNDAGMYGCVKMVLD